MIFPIIYRYLSGELLKPLIFCILGFMLVMVSSFLFEYSDLLIIKKVPFPVVTQLLIYKLPALLVETFPIALLFASVYSLSRLVQDNEITAMRTGGVSLHAILLPFLIIAVLFSAMAYFINEEVVPWTNHKSKNIIRKTILKDTMPQVRENIFFKGPGGRFFYIEKIFSEQEEVHNVLVYETEPEEVFADGQKGVFPRVITARRGYFCGKTLTLQDGIIHEFDARGQLMYESEFNNLELQIEQDLKNFYGQQRTPSEMSREELAGEIKLFEKSGLNVDSLQVEYHLKLAFPFASLIFVLIGAPLSLSLKQGKGFGIAAAIVILFLYQVGVSISRSLGRNHLLDPLLAAWLPNLVFALIGIFLLFREEYIKNWRG